MFSLYKYIRYILFSSNHNTHKSSCGLHFWASDPLIDRLSKNKGLTNFYECCDLTEKVYLRYTAPPPSSIEYYTTP